jgi:hypothetical protein
MEAENSSETLVASSILHDVTSEKTAVLISAVSQKRLSLEISDMSTSIKDGFH